MIRINQIKYEMYLSVNFILIYSHTFRSKWWLIGCYEFVLLAVLAVQAILVWESSHREVCVWQSEVQERRKLSDFMSEGILLRFFSSISSSNNCLSKGKKKLFMVGWSWLCVWEALTSDRNMGTDIMPPRACVYERRRGEWSGWHFVSRFSKVESLL